MNEVVYTHLAIPELLKKAENFKLSGNLQINDSGLVYLDVDDNFIHELFPVLHSKYSQTNKPGYFGLDSIGAHISVIYPEENINIPDQEIGKSYDFQIFGLYSAIINTKTYYVLLVKSPALLKLRKKYGLSNQLNFKGYAIDLHITIGVSYHSPS